MKVRDVLKTLSAGCIVYVVMAACSGSEKATSGGTTSSSSSGAGGGQGGTMVAGGSGGATGQGGASGAPSSGGFGGWLDDGGLLDVLTDPVADASAEDIVNGTRLKARRRLAADGAKQFVGWYDSQLGVECEFELASDGVERCLPRPRIAVSTKTYFEDAACTKPVAFTEPGCAAPAYAQAFVEDVCDTPAMPKQTHPTYAVGAKLPSGFVQAGTCEPYTAGAWDLYQIGEEIPPSTFVSASIETDP